MATNLADHILTAFEELRYLPLERRIRASLSSTTVIDTATPILVWEPRRVVPLYAVPEADIMGTVANRAPTIADTESDAGVLGERHVLAVGDFDIHLTPGDLVTVETTAGEIAGFRPTDPALAGYVIVDFDGPDVWLEEDDEVVSHPRDPFHRVDIRQSSRHVRIERDGKVLAESSVPRLVFETHLPTRFYLPRSDIRDELFEPSPTSTGCAYKGRASYLSARVGDRVIPDLAWTYPQPLPDATQLTGLVAFFDERVDVIVDGKRRERPTTPWSDDD